MRPRVDDDYPPRTFGPITRSDIVRYQGASGDFNPIHHDEVFARNAGYQSVISVGMLQAGYVATYCVDHFGPHAIRSIRVRFASVVEPGDVLTCRGKVSRLAEVDGEHCAAVDLSLENERDGATVLTAVVLVATRDIQLA